MSCPRTTNGSPASSSPPPSSTRSTPWTWPIRKSARTSAGSWPPPNASCSPGNELCHMMKAMDLPDALMLKCGAPSTSRCAFISLCGVSLALLAGCAVGPDYKRPVVDTPASYRTAGSDTHAPSGTNSFADFGWWETFQDPQLTAYLAEALTNSWDIK